MCLYWISSYFLQSVFLRRWDNFKFHSSPWCTADFPDLCLPQINQTPSLPTFSITTEDTELCWSQSRLSCPSFRASFQLGSDCATKLPLQSRISLASVRWHQKRCRSSAALKEGPRYGCWLNLGEHLGGNLHGSPGSVKEWGRRTGSTVAQIVTLPCVVATYGKPHKC